MSESNEGLAFEIPECMLDGNFDLHRVDCDEVTARTLAPYLHELSKTVKSVEWIERPVLVDTFAHAVPNAKHHTLNIELFDFDCGQEVLDARAAFYRPLDALVLAQYDQSGHVARYVVFTDVETESVKTKLHAANGNAVVKEVKLNAVSMRFKSVKEFKEYPNA